MMVMFSVPCLTKNFTVTLIFIANIFAKFPKCKITYLRHVKKKLVDLVEELYIKK